jgi:hypothetical protein
MVTDTKGEEVDFGCPIGSPFSEPYSIPGIDIFSSISVPIRGIRGQSFE